MLKKEQECHVFAKWGCLLGLGAPIGLAMLYDFFGSRPHLVFPRHVHGLFVITAAVAIVGAYFAKHWYSICTNDAAKVKRIDFFLYAIGVVTCLLIGLIVVFTGGVLRSVFSYYFLYLPSIVAVSFTPAEDSKGRGLIFVSLTCAAMIAVGLLFATTESQTYKAFCDSAPRKFGHFAIAVIQLSAIILIERKRTG